MRNRRGKGQIFVLDVAMQKHVEKLRREKGFYPTLRVIGETFDPPLSPALVFRSLRRLAAAGKLAPEAELIYNSKKRGPA